VSESNGIVIIPILPWFRRCSRERPQSNPFVINTEQIREVANYLVWICKQSSDAIE